MSNPTEIIRNSDAPEVDNLNAARASTRVGERVKLKNSFGIGIFERRDTRGWNLQRDYNKRRKGPKHWKCIAEIISAG